MQQTNWFLFFCISKVRTQAKNTTSVLDRISLGTISYHVVTIGLHYVVPHFYSRIGNQIHLQREFFAIMAQTVVG